MMPSKLARFLIQKWPPGKPPVTCSQTSVGEAPLQIVEKRKYGLSTFRSGNRSASTGPTVQIRAAAMHSQ